MTEDLESTLNELGPEYRAVVNRLRAPFSEAEVSHRNSSFSIFNFSFPRALIAASILLVFILAIWNFSSIAPDSSLQTRNSGSLTVYTAAYAQDEFALKSILDSQKHDGSWSNDYLTMQNAAALRKVDDEASRIAYKRAVRYLRAKGLGPISDEELRRRSAMQFSYLQMHKNG